MQQFKTHDSLSWANLQRYNPDRRLFRHCEKATKHFSTFVPCRMLNDSTTGVNVGKFSTMWPIKAF